MENNEVAVVAAEEVAEKKESIITVFLVSFGALLCLFCSCFSWYYSTIKELFVQTSEWPGLYMTGVLGIIFSAIAFCLGVTLKIMHNNVFFGLIFGAIIAACGLGMIIIGFFVQWWPVFVIAGLLCILGGVYAMFFNFFQKLFKRDKAAENA